ncbi:UvrD-helicase domain-containing protein [Mycobacterium kansasii]|uniref:DNA 3'-5' helicase n=3 Tax=Mycobacterium kansasii TaxID=1768 RepID=A0A653EK39_MYCKA|nr:UvrD-helicase domain-containing protein [Mycobacterium kansasii]EUA05728.1 uvrD/REP helicase N-terminal domain protein [Mycobacterium kansasii 824]AGZ52171.1 DNA helicase [Mycobacterium kansasii ATCC 12478]ARG56143.1 DNA helicase [Mycobacterium kansasii]ARG69273.1 DNA helicase [Mycobacterium kansasii]ARG76100.1 DNA helicase [Mycobacterium kansasii]
MPTLAIDKGFLADLVKLEKPVAKRVTEVFDEFDTATHTGLHLEKINNARNPRFRSIRIDQSWRGIILAPEAGDVYTLLKVLPHDDAYAWAQRSNVSVNTATGGIEIRDEEAIDRALPQLAKAAEKAESRLFDKISDADLTRLGIDHKTRAFARALTNPGQLDEAKSALPETQWDVLCGLAAGFTPDEVWADLGAQILNEPVDTEDLDAAVLRSRDRVVLVNGPEELMNVFAYPFATWRVYLHPTQRAVVDASYKGPARVTGGPGTGKTVVVLHRAHVLAKRNEGRVLVTTFTSTLTDTLRSGLDMIVDDDEVDERIEVSNVDRLAHRIFRRKHGPPNLLNADDDKGLWLSIIDKLGLPFTDVFLAEEWRHVVLARRIGTAAAYLSAKRTGRGRALGSRQRAQVWQAMWEFEQALTQLGAWTHETIRREATALLEADTTKPYRHIVIDEAQDLSPDQWRLLRAAVAEAPDDIFIAGDTHQRIYNNRVSLRDVGINIAGRSTRLNLNYRTTAEILGWSLGLLRGERIDDMEGGLDSIAGCRSYVHGAPPRLQGFDKLDAETRFIASTVNEWINSGVAPSEIGIAVRAKWFGSKVADALKAMGIKTVDLAKASTKDDAVHVGTMHRMKGLEFRCVGVAGVGAKFVPAANAVTPIDEDRQTHEQDLERERCLLFVACTRAREELLVTWHGQPSPFLTASTADSAGAQ